MLICVKWLKWFRARQTTSTTSQGLQSSVTHRQNPGGVTVPQRARRPVVSCAATRLYHEWQGCQHDTNNCLPSMQGQQDTEDNEDVGWRTTETEKNARTTRHRGQRDVGWSTTEIDKNARTTRHRGATRLYQPLKPSRGLFFVIGGELEGVFTKPGELRCSHERMREGRARGEPQNRKRRHEAKNPWPRGGRGFVVCS